MYKPLAIKYRPENLGRVIGQDGTVRILRTAIANGRLGSSVIMTGIRGTGKTSIARIIAKALNCLGSVESVPCGSCASCTAISSATTFDILEMDAASNTGVDDIRAILESCQYKPADLKYKVFIIDEVHMLSKSAFNALLKTLEEPPTHVKFIFATTEVEKVPDTILSRCMRFDLRRVNTAELSQYLSGVANQEGVSIEPAAINIIAKMSDGSVRDSLSLLDQVFHLPQPIKRDDVAGLLGVVDNHALSDLLAAMLDADPQAAVRLARDMHSWAQSARQIFDGLLELLHFMICAKAQVVDLSDYFISDDVKARLNKMAADATIPSLNQVWQVILKGVEESAAAIDDRLVLEMAVLRVCYLAPLPDLYSILSGVSAFAKPPSESNSRKPEQTESEKQKISSLDDVMRLIRDDSVLAGFVKQYVSLDDVSGGLLRMSCATEFSDKLKRSLEIIMSDKGYRIRWDVRSGGDGLLKDALNMFPGAKVQG